MSSINFIFDLTEQTSMRMQMPLRDFEKMSVLIKYIEDGTLKEDKLYVMRIVCCVWMFCVNERICNCNILCWLLFYSLAFAMLSIVVLCNLYIH